MTTATNCWISKLHDVMGCGFETNPRGMKTLEVLASSSTFDMNYPIIQVPARKLGMKFLYAEAAWILSGDNRVSSINPYSKEISKFSDDGVTFFGAYGPRVIDQLHYIVKCLAEDQDSRQAVMTIWRPNPPKTKDVPCTIAVQWFIRDGKLYCIDTMRSSDLWLGWPYDAFNFSILSLAIIVRLRKYGIYLKLGDMTLVAGSQHIYERNWGDVKKIIAPNMSTDIDGHKGTLPFHVFNAESQDTLVDALWFHARDNS